MNLTQIKAVIFDMDGVILDSETISWKTWEIAAGELGIPDINHTNSLCMGANRNDTCQILRNVYGEGFESEKFLARTYELFEQIEKESGIPLIPGAKEAIEYLSEKYTLALASSTRKEAVYRQLKNAGVFDFFTTITTGDMVSHSKPDPEIYLKAAASIGMKPQQCAAIEDSPNGIKSASAAGLYTIMVPDKVKPDSSIQKLCGTILSSLNQISSIL